MNKPARDVRMRPIDIGILGPLFVTFSGREAQVRSARVQKLLVLLAVHHNNTVSFDRIVDVLWDDPPKTARQQVYNVVSTLRDVLAESEGAAVVESAGNGYRLTVPADAVDSARFESYIRHASEAETRGSGVLAADLLERALREWRGPLTDHLAGPHGEVAAAALCESRLESVERLAGLLVQQGRSARIFAVLQGLVAEFPFRESLRAVLMRVLSTNGRQVEALACFEEGRTLLADEFGLDPGQLMRDAHREVLEARGVERGTAIPTTFSYLARDIPEFSGRAAEVGMLVDRARAAQGRALLVSEISGMGGVGKTTLAVHVAHRLGGDYPDGHYFLDLLGFSVERKPLEPALALASLLWQSGVAPEDIPTSAEERGDLWRSRTAGKRVLVLLDDAADEAQVRPLLPGSAHSLVLVTGRRRMSALQGSVSLTLGAMTDEDATDLFCAVAGRERTEKSMSGVSEVVRLCGNLPLALHVAASRLRNRPAWTTRELVDRLGDDRVRPRFLVASDRSVTEVIARSYHRLTHQQQHLFRLLGVHSSPVFDASLVAATMGCPLDAAEDRLEELVDANVLEQRGLGRYGFHGLMRDCARELAGRTSQGDRSKGFTAFQTVQWTAAAPKLAGYR